MAALRGTFFAFRRRERAGVLAGATAAHFILALAVVVIFGVLTVAMVAGVREVSARTTALTIAPLVVIVGVFFYIVIMASYEAACLRWLVRGETAGFGGFSLGGDTWRVYAGYWIWFGACLAAYVSVFVIAVLVMAAASVTTTLPRATWWIGYVVIGAWVLLVTPFALRLSSGNAVSVARRKLSYFRGWTVSRGRTGALFGSFAVLWLIWLMLFVALMIGLMFVGYYAVGGTTGDPPSQMINIAFSAGALGALFIANMVMALLSAGLNARVVLAAAEEGKLDGVTTNVAEVFD
jgi:hypothetical protein